MSMPNAITVEDNQESLVTIVHRAVAILKQARQKRREQARIEHELKQYSDRELADLGMSRSEIPFIARGGLR